ncbi:hypothetical protein MOO46_07825 (plasmid) [Apilactobacillus apisilvae]|uniref:Uncharacterized protein n=1 Tax=Apilactobacillus apisilvae TaxID=2923364 RepID=A0ABY4PJM3_9LACO|nr:hypothetical protein [Apilactobacillus apisilvae]UQS85840.1 hypothetical protein MOO46_07825 [Apilactobacillus apisilvae]
MPSYRKNKHPTIIWDAEVEDVGNKKQFIEKVTISLCNCYGVSEFIIPTKIVNPHRKRQDLLHEILTLVLDKTKLKT